MRICPTCNRIAFEDHKCPPKWKVQLDAEPRLPRTIFAQNEDEAAERYGEWFARESSDDSIDVTVEVSPFGQPDQTKKKHIESELVLQVRISDHEEEDR